MISFFHLSKKDKNIHDTLKRLQNIFYFHIIYYCGQLKGRKNRKRRSNRCGGKGGKQSEKERQEDIKEERKNMKKTWRTGMRVIKNK